MAIDTLTSPAEPAPAASGQTGRRDRSTRLFDAAIIRRAVLESFLKLTPRQMVKAPVLFVVYIGSIWSTVIFLRDVGNNPASENVFEALVLAFVWFVVLFGNFAEALAEGRGKAQADTLRKTRSETVAHVLQPDGTIVDKPSSALTVGDEVVCNPGDLIPGDGDVVEGIAAVDESAITGESAPVIRESGGDRSSVTGGTR